MRERALTELKRELGMTMQGRVYLLQRKDGAEKHGCCFLLRRCLEELAEIERDIAQLEIELASLSPGGSEAFEPVGWEQRLFPEVEAIPIEEDEIPF